MKFKISALVLASFVSSPVLAAEAATSYIGLQYAQGMYEGDGNFEADPHIMVARLGHYLTDYLAIEGRVGFGVSDDELEWDNMDTGITAEIDNLYGAYIVGHLPLSEVASLYALAGYTQGEATLSLGSESISDDDSGFSYGIGGQINFSPAIAGTIEYTSYLDKSDYQISAIGAGLNFRF